ncbi:hypothetical protein F4824DRAFT_33200 [Ustulina deusta]|nr:hypothetical protein F4824DRAFT_33200 [Ustulina deusta]
MALHMASIVRCRGVFEFVPYVSYLMSMDELSGSAFILISDVAAMRRGYLASQQPPSPCCTAFHISLFALFPPPRLPNQTHGRSHCLSACGSQQTNDARPPNVKPSCPLYGQDEALSAPWPENKTTKFKYKTSQGKFMGAMGGFGKAKAPFLCLSNSAGTSKGRDFGSQHRTMYDSMTVKSRRQDEEVKGWLTKRSGAWQALLAGITEGDSAIG